MTYDYAVKYNGKIYGSGEQIPDEQKPGEQKPAAEARKKAVKENGNGNSGKSSQKAVRD